MCLVKYNVKNWYTLIEQSSYYKEHSLYIKSEYSQSFVPIALYFKHISIIKIMHMATYIQVYYTYLST